ncbi:O-fucosyltransferase 36-like protein [Drosera capensis]
MVKEVSRENPQEDESDRQSLIPQSKPKPTSNLNHFSTLDIASSRSHRLNGKGMRRYLFLVILIPLLVCVILYIFVDFRGLFGGWRNGYVEFSGGLTSIDRMRESELRSMYLLREQQLGLLALLNHSLGTENSSELIVSEIYKQISLNLEIQQVLLSAHKGGNVSDLGFGGGDDLVNLGSNMCGKVERNLGARKKIEWKPRSDRYLFAICVSRKMSNHLICLEKHMFFAAILGRIMVIPSHKVDYQFSRMLDIEHINKCVGRKVVVTFEEFHEVKKKNFRINKFICYFSFPDRCYLDEDHVKKLKGLGLSIPNLESPWHEDVKNPTKRTVKDIDTKFGSDDEVIAIGDVFFADVEKDWVMQSGGPIAHMCKTLIEPSRLIILTAQRFIQTFLGRDYVALHFRRHGFLKFCNVNKLGCFYSIPQAADCIRRVVQRAKAPVIYLSTDAAKSETGLLRSLIVFDGRPVPLVTRPARNSAEKWDALLYRHGLEGDSRVEAMLDKTICAMSSVFIGSSGSTFTEDIFRLRKDWGSASTCDSYICEGEVPNFVAEDE